MDSFNRAEIPPTGDELDNFDFDGYLASETPCPQLLVDYKISQDETAGTQAKQQRLLTGLTQDTDEVGAMEEAALSMAERKQGLTTKLPLPYSQQDCERLLMLLEQENNKRLLMERQQMDSLRRAPKKAAPTMTEHQESRRYRQLKVMQQAQLSLPPIGVPPRRFRTPNLHIRYPHQGLPVSGPTNHETSALYDYTSQALALEEHNRRQLPSSKQEQDENSKPVHPSLEVLGYESGNMAPLPPSATTGPHQIVRRQQQQQQQNELYMQDQATCQQQLSQARQQQLSQARQQQLSQARQQREIQQTESPKFQISEPRVRAKDSGKQSLTQEQETAAKCHTWDIQHTTQQYSSLQKPESNITGFANNGNHMLMQSSAIAPGCSPIATPPRSALQELQALTGTIRKPASRTRTLSSSPERQNLPDPQAGPSSLISEQEALRQLTKRAQSNERVSSRHAQKKRLTARKQRRLPTRYFSSEFRPISNGRNAGPRTDANLKKWPNAVGYPRHSTMPVAQSRISHTLPGSKATATDGEHFRNISPLFEQQNNQRDNTSHFETANQAEHHYKHNGDPLQDMQSVPDSFSNMRADMTASEYTEKLQLEVQRLRHQIAQVSPRILTTQESESPWPTLHRVYCDHNDGVSATYLDQPVWILVDGHYHLDSRHRVPDESLWESRQQTAPFVVYLIYRCEDHLANRDERPRNPEYQDSASLENLQFATKPSSEGVHILSEGLRLALEATFAEHTELALFRPHDFATVWGLETPYVMNYHFRPELEGFAVRLSQICGSHYQLLLEYIKRQAADTETKANELFSQGLLSVEYMPYFFQPGQILVTDTEHGPAALKQTTKVRMKKDNEWACGSESIEFNGGFSMSSSELTIKVPDPDKNDQTMSIADLSVFPLKYAAEIKAHLLERGRFFWQCRKGLYVTGPEQGSSELVETRYMVDADTYRLMYRGFEPCGDVKGIAQDDFLVRLPPRIKGYHMQDKKWIELSVDKLSAVDWKTDAFESLAVDNDTKELIQAVVTNKIEADKSTDLIAGKGNGLIVLLHGGPGTGKTLTAESVAEIAKRPLYRVTCGDIGTEPRKVEEYLEQVLNLGRRWGCVVLLDQADVFLEQRSIANLERNALVSVFLRVLEYYDGILLLTSNRVGTFDEAFRSRIQLAIHYQSLTQDQRKQIWGNFIRRLERLEEDMDIANIQWHLPELASYRMNGWQIRNVVTTSRQLAKFKGEKLSYAHIRRAIGVSTKFENYLWK